MPQADNCGCLDPIVAATAAGKTIQEKGPLDARSKFQIEPRFGFVEAVRYSIDSVLKCYGRSGHSIE